MKKILHYLDEYLEEFLMVIFLIAMTLIMGIQVFSRYILGISNYLSKKVSNKNNIPEIGASDAHFVEGLGCCYTEIPVTDSVDTLLKYIKKGKSTAHGKRTPMDLIIREVIRKKGHRTIPKEN